MQQAGFIEKHPVRNMAAAEMLEVFLGSGEAESLVLAQELSCSILFLDNLRGRKAAQAAGLRTIGVAGFLLAAKQQGLAAEIRSLQEHGFQLSRVLIETVLREAGEL